MLTVAGPDSWPLRGGVPSGVTFLGKVPHARVGELMNAADLLVMPSLLEGFGIVFAEALSRGLPCIGRDACAMPEIIDPISGGRLVTSMSPDELAALIHDALHDDGPIRRVRASRGPTARPLHVASSRPRGCRRCARCRGDCCMTEIEMGFVRGVAPQEGVVPYRTSTTKRPTGGPGYVPTAGRG